MYCYYGYDYDTDKMKVVKGCFGYEFPLYWFVNTSNLTNRQCQFMAAGVFVYLNHRLSENIKTKEDLRKEIDIIADRLIGVKDEDFFVI